MTRRLTVADAASCAKQFGYPWMLCELDHEEGRRATYVRPLRYSQEDEFLALGGRILAIGYPDGSTRLLARAAIARATETTSTQGS